MTIAAIGGPDLLIVLVIVVLLFGEAKLPQLARSLGEANRDFEKATAEPLRRDHTAD